MFQKIAVIAITIICHQYYFKWTIKMVVADVKRNWAGSSAKLAKFNAIMSDVYGDFGPDRERLL